jgi:SNF2 family DNA or RNA helicase
VAPTLTKNGDQLEVNLSGCRGSEFRDAKEKIRAIPGRRWDPQSKNWIVPADPVSAERILKTIQPEAADELINWITESKASYEESLTSPIPDDADDLLLDWAYKRLPHQPEYVNDEEFKGLLPYQRAGVRHMGERAVLADDMGLGKTIQAIAAVEEWRLRNGHADGPKLIVCPSSVKGSWERELRRWLPPETEVHVIAGSYAKTKASSAEEKRASAIQRGIEANAWIIVNWEQLRCVKQKVKTKRRNGTFHTKTVKVMKEPLFENTEWLAVVADEVHRAKNPKAQQSIGLWRTRGQVMYGLTGTPIMNSPDELWSILRWLWPDEFHELGLRKNAVAYSDFYETYVDYWEDHFKRKIITGVKNPDALRFLLKGKMIRRTAKILGLKGRKRIRYPVPLTPKQQKLYDEAENSMWLAVAEDIAAGNQSAIQFAQAAAKGGDPVTLYNIPNGAARFVRLRQVIENAALLGGPDESANMDDFEQKFIDSRPEPWVVYCEFKDSCEILAERLRKKYGATVEVYTGDVRPADRTYIEDRFQRGEIDVIVGTIGAMREGITLTRSHLQHWVSRAMVPAWNEQGEAREDRLGQQKQVLVYIPQAEGTVVTGNVEPTNRVKEKIVSTVIPMDEIKEGTKS